MNADKSLFRQECFIQQWMKDHSQQSSRASCCRPRPYKTKAFLCFRFLPFVFSSLVSFVSTLGPHSSGCCQRRWAAPPLHHLPCPDPCSPSAFWDVSAFPSPPLFPPSSRYPLLLGWSLFFQCLISTVLNSAAFDKSLSWLCFVSLQTIRIQKCNPQLFCSEEQRCSRPRCPAGGLKRPPNWPVRARLHTSAFSHRARVDFTSSAIWHYK